MIRRRAEAKKQTKKTPDEPELRKRITLRDPALRKPHEAGERPAGAKPFAILLKEIGTQTGIPVIAECDYKPKDSRWLSQQRWLADEIISRPLYEVLDLICSDYEYEWAYFDGVLLLRPRLWFADPKDRKYLLGYETWNKP